MSFHRLSGVLCLVCCLAAVSGCGGSQSATSPHTSVAGARSFAPSTGSSGSPEVQAPSTMSAQAQTTAVVVGASGAYLHPPGPKDPRQPTAIPASDDCHKLTSDSIQSVVTCATATSPRGTITAVLVAEAHTEHVNVYLRQGRTAKLILTGLDQTSLDHQVRLGSVDPSHDGYNKIALVESVTQNVNSLSRSPLVAGYELVDPPGKVTLHRSLNGGAVTTTSLGLFDYVDEGPRSVLASQIVYERSAWRITYQRHDSALPEMKDPDLLVPSCGTAFC